MAQQVSRLLEVMRERKRDLPDAQLVMRTSFIAGAVIFSSLDVLSQFQDELQLRSCVAITVCSLLLALCGWNPRRYGTLLLGFTYVCFVVPEQWFSIGIVSFDACIVLAVWLSQRRYLAVAIGYFGFIGFHFVNYSGTAFELGMELIIQTLFVLFLGLIGMWLRAHLSRMNQQRDEAQVRGGEDFRQQMTVYLHNTVARDLSRLLLTCQGLQGITPDDELKQIIGLSREALMKLRHVMGERGIEQLPDACPSQALAGAVELLAVYSNDLYIEGQELLDQRFEAPVAEVITLFIGEAAINIVKHGAKPSPVQLVIERAGGSLLMVCSNQVRLVDQDVSLRGGRGLAIVADRLQTLGGTCSYGQIGDAWMWEVTVPLSVKVKA